ncbi:MAG: PilZ domain-containing protein [Pyrinomonadaceae bacterium]
MRERRGGERHVISYPIRVRWKDVTGKEVVQEGLTENVGPHGTLIYLPRSLPVVGGKVQLTVTENPEDEVSVTAEVIRLERNAAHPQVALNLLDNLREWKKKVWESAGHALADQKPEAPDDW